MILKLYLVPFVKEVRDEHERCVALQHGEELKYWIFLTEEESIFEKEIGEEYKLNLLHQFGL